VRRAVVQVAVKVAEAVIVRQTGGCIHDGLCAEASLSSAEAPLAEYRRVVPRGGKHLGRHHVFGAKALGNAVIAVDARVALVKAGVEHRAARRADGRRVGVPKPHPG
jgi:hypothetical protein